MRAEAAPSVPRRSPSDQAPARLPRGVLPRARRPGCPGAAWGAASGRAGARWGSSGRDEAARGRRAPCSPCRAARTSAGERRGRDLGRGEARACASEGVSKEAPARPVDQGLVGYQRARRGGRQERGGRQKMVARTWRATCVLSQARSACTPATGCTRGCNPTYRARTRPRPRCARRRRPRCAGRSGARRSRGARRGARRGRPWRACAAPAGSA